MRDICFASVADISARVRAGELRSVDVARAHIERANQRADLGAFLRIDGDGALEQARAVDEAVARGEDPGPLAGVVVGLKDTLCTKGLVTTAGSKILKDWVPPYDATPVERLRSAGAVIIGKLNMDEFAMGSSTEASAYGPCRNPWDVTRVPGGSSGGSAAAVAAGLCTVALGSDTGGSIRQPAGFCGVVGVKPTYGRVSRYGLIAFASSLDCVGPLARSVHDAASVLEVISGADARDATSIDEPALTLRNKLDSGVAGMTIGVPAEMFPDSLDDEVRVSVRRALAELEEAGASIVDISLPHTRYALATYYLIAPAEASSNLARYDGVRFGKRVEASTLFDMYRKTRGEYFGDEVIRRIIVGTYALRAGYCDKYYIRAQKARALIKRDFDRAFESRVDVIASPTSPTVAFALGEKSSPLDMYLADLFTLSCSLAGLPGVSVPAQPSSAKLPIGLQLIGRAGGEADLLRVARVCEERQPWADRRPPEPVARGVA